LNGSAYAWGYLEPTLNELPDLCWPKRVLKKGANPEKLNVFAEDRRRVDFGRRQKAFVLFAAPDLVASQYPQFRKEYLYGAR
jgi:hypothetical protein